MNLFFVSSSPLILIPAFVLCEGCSDEDKLLLQVDGALKAALPIPPATPTRGEPHPFSSYPCKSDVMCTKYLQLLSTQEHFLYCSI